METLPRLHGGTGECLECERGYEAHEGPPAGRDFDYTAREIAEALVRVGQGATDSRAGREARTAAGRLRSGRTTSGRRVRNNDGSVVADWIELYAPALFAPHAPTEWPRIVALDALPFKVRRRDANGNPVRSGKAHFQVFGAYGWEKSWQPGRLLALRAMPNFGYRQGFPFWVEFLQQLRGELEGELPFQIVCDNDFELVDAIRAVWPPADGPSPVVFLCHWHLRAALQRRMRRKVLRPDPLWDAIEHKRGPYGHCTCAFCSLQSYQQFEQDVLARRIPALAHWVKDYGKTVERQLQARGSLQAITDTGALEQAFTVIRNALEDRRGRITNRARLDRRLLLMQLDLNGEANASRYAQVIRHELAANDGHGGSRKLHDDQAGTRSSLQPF